MWELRRPTPACPEDRLIINRREIAIDQYPNFATLARSETKGSDYRIELAEVVSSSVAVIAPHGGSIERRTSEIARAIAGDDFNCYLFEGLDPAGSFETLHITSHRFDEPKCLELLTRCDTVLAVHGASGDQQGVMLGGLDSDLRSQMASALTNAGIDVHSEGHNFPGTHPRNICNRGRRGKGVQLELTDGLRGAPSEHRVVESVRDILFAYAHDAQKTR